MTVEYESLELCLYFIDMGADIHAVDHLFNTALHHSAQKGHVDTTIALISLGADVNATNI